MRQTTVVKTRTGRGRRDDWSQLVGRTVEVWFQGEQVATGVVDLAASDDTVLWLAAQGIQRRKLYDKLAGYEVWA
ncbi:hypothetical protein [Sinomonas humi]|uniref:Uncharacterized protein n=1 Tax=Sinomonas humi TaxID=1338436 RepID=A0A0B2AGC7_9MICC|nr:hypothetical protein [Sinomonas humi]KHL00954.1 hypothetical protein LK10_18305 [Sinomonas humi]